MPIDRIGKGGGVSPQVPGASGTGGSSPTKKVFEIDAPAAAAGAPAAAGVERVAASPLEQLRAGKIDVNQYVDLKLDEATSHLRGLRASELQQIREVLRDKIVQDPQFVDLMRQATGSVPMPTDE
jgi:hypothetical protein